MSPISGSKTVVTSENEKSRKQCKRFTYRPVTIPLEKSVLRPSTSSEYVLRRLNCA